MTVARKVLRQSGSVGEEDIKNEIRALDKLCRADRGEFLVQVFHHRPADDTSPSIGVYQVDMELCLGNLKTENMCAKNVNERNTIKNDSLQY